MVLDVVSNVKVIYIYVEIGQYVFLKFRILIGYLFCISSCNKRLTFDILKRLNDFEFIEEITDDWFVFELFFLSVYDVRCCMVSLQMRSSGAAYVYFSITARFHIDIISIILQKVVEV
jgi:hypothetical protein